MKKGSTLGGYILFFVLGFLALSLAIQYSKPSEPQKLVPTPTLSSATEIKANGTSLATVGFRNGTFSIEDAPGFTEQVSNSQDPKANKLIGFYGKNDGPLAHPRYQVYLFVDEARKIIRVIRIQKM